MFRDEMCMNVEEFRKSEIVAGQEIVKGGVMVKN
jgi:hypothetical protein